jgi:hypothetical protein
MKKFLTILFLLPLLASCSNEDTLLTERDKIEKYLTSSRHLIAEEEKDSVIEEEPAFYTVFGRFAYRHIVNYYDEGREDKPIVEWGDKLQIRFTAYIFTGNEPSKSAIYWSNEPEIINELGKTGDNTLDWSTEPLHITLGTTDIIEGVERALQARLEGQEDPTISLHCDKTVAIDEVVKVMNVAKDNNYKLILATQP